MQTFGDPPPSVSSHPASLSFSRVGRYVELALLLGATLAVSHWSVHSGGAQSVIAALLGVLPAAVALQHGLLAGLLATALVGGSVVLGPGDVLHTLLPSMLAPFALALAVGHFTDCRRRVKLVLEQRAAEQGRRLEQLFRTYNVLRSSHAQLEERLAAREWSLDAAVRETELRVGARSLEGACVALLELLAGPGRVGRGAIYVARRGVLPSRPDAQLGQRHRCEGLPAPVARAFARASMLTLEPTDASDSAPDEALVALPLIGTGGHTVGVVAIYELPFVAFHEAHFRLLSTLIAPFADALARKAQEPEPVHRALPPPTRALERLRGVAIRIAANPSVAHAAMAHPARAAGAAEAGMQAVLTDAPLIDDDDDDDEPTVDRRRGTGDVRL